MVVDAETVGLEKDIHVAVQKPTSETTVNMVSRLSVLCFIYLLGKNSI